MMALKQVRTPQLKLAYEESGPAKGETLLLLHGWPDSARTWDAILPMLHQAGYRTIAPYLRGYKPTTFRRSLLRPRPRHTGQPVAFAQDCIDLADRLKMERFHFIGHDWGARTGYALAALFPERLKTLTALSVAFTPGMPPPPELPQARAYWYQWLLCTEPGEARFRKDPIAFGRAQWDTWSPPGWYGEAEFEETAKSWKGKDYEDVVLHSYRSRWGHAALDPAYAKLQARLVAARSLTTPTLLLHGAEDRCLLPASSEDSAQYFRAEYRRVLIEGAGHFLQRERPAEVAAEILHHVR